MPKLPVISGKKLLKALLKAGFVINRQSGSHAQLYHSEKPGLLVTIPVHTKTLPKGTLKNILRQAEMTVDELINFL